MVNLLCCTKCGINKEATSENFFWRKDTQSWRLQCKYCRMKATKEWELRNIDKVVIWRKQWHNKYNKEYYDNNTEKEKLRAKNKPKHLKAKYQRVQKLKPKNRIRGNISRSISHYIKKQGGIKNISHLSYVDWTYDELLRWLESRFEPWMNWNNYGRYNHKTWDDSNQLTWTWQIDHIICHSEFKYSSMSDDEFRQCWSLKNLRPYSAKQNIIDGNRRQ